MTRPAIHPGEILADELLELGITATELARQVKVPANRITQIVKGYGVAFGSLVWN
jgi:antitoxin HigA-1